MKRAEGSVPPGDLRTEAIAGVTTFFTMAYIVIVNPSILSTPGTGMPFSGVLTATVLIAASMTLLMGLYARIPFAVAPGMGLNAFFTFSIILGRHVPWPTALGMVFWSGVLFVAVSATPLRESIARAIPPTLRTAAGAGIGIFLTFIGLKNGSIVVADPATLVTIGSANHQMLLTLLGLVVTIVLLHYRSSLAFLGGIFVVTVAAAIGGWVDVPKTILSAPDFHSVFLKLDIFGALKLSLIPATVSILLTDLFDSLSTFVGVSDAAGLLDENGEAKGLRQGLLVDAFATLGAGLAGTSPGTAYIESAAGIEMGGRTGMTSVFTALCFLPCFFIAPLAGMVPAYASAPVLIVVGTFMFRNVTKLSLEALEDAIPAFLTIVLIPLTFSITQGILWGFIAHVGLYLLAGRRKEISATMYVLALIGIGLLSLEYSGI